MGCFASLGAVFMNKFFIALFALIGLLVAIVLLAPQLIPAKTYKGRLETAASTAMGRSVTMGDDISFSIFPQTAFRVSSLEIANAEGFTDDYFARVSEAQIGVKLFPLFSGEVELDQFILTEPDIKLERTKSGLVNWNLAQTTDNAPADDNAGALPQLRDLRLGDVRIVNGTATYTDHMTDAAYTAETINLDITLNSLNTPLEADGNLVFQGTPSKIDIVLTTPGKILNKEEANLKIDMVLGATSASADLALNLSDTLSYAGPVRLDAPDLPAFAALMGAALQDAPGFDALAVSGAVTGGANGLRLAGADIQFDKIDAHGDIAFDWSKVRPMATGALDAGTLDLRPYLPPPTETPEGFPAWSEDKLDLSSLRNIDAQFDVTADSIFLNDIKTGKSELKLIISNGRMTAEIPELAMYGGQGSGRLVVNARNATPTFSGVFDMSAVNAEPFSLDLLKTDRLLGLGSFKFDFTANGASQAAIMRSLDGAGGFDVANGALKGFNLLKLARTATTLEGGLNPAAIANAIATAQGVDEVTDFSEFLSNFTIDNGLVTTKTINLNGPFLTMIGSGSVNLPEQSLDLRLAPKATSTASGEGGRALTIPLRLTGTFNNPKIAIDVESLAQGRAETQVRGLLDNVLGKEENADAEGADPETSPEEGAADRLIDGLFGKPKKKDPTPDNTGDASETPDPTGQDLVKDALGNLFGQPQADEQPEEEAAEDEPK